MESPNDKLSTSIQATDLRYFTTHNNPVKINAATVSLQPVVGGKLLTFTFTFTFTAFTDQVIPGGEMLIDFLFEGVQFLTEKYDLSHGVSCPISSGNFVLTFSQVVPVSANAGGYTVKLKILNQDRCQLSWVALDFTIPRDPTINYPDPTNVYGGPTLGRGRYGPVIRFPSLDGLPIISFELVGGEHWDA